MWHCSAKMTEKVPKNNADPEFVTSNNGTFQGRAEASENLYRFEEDQSLNTGLLQGGCTELFPFFSHFL
jgi:hypothetical protein